MAFCQNGDVIVTKSYCNQNDAGAAKIRIHIPSMHVAWDQPSCWHRFVTCAFTPSTAINN